MQITKSFPRSFLGTGALTEFQAFDDFCLVSEAVHNSFASRFEARTVRKHC